jgi:hypothetical protein
VVREPATFPRPLEVTARRLAVLAVAALGLLVGCAREDEAPPLPPACTAGPEAVLRALEAAPRPVRVDGVRLSACIPPSTSGSELQAVGPTLVGAASELSDAAARRPEGPAALRLGYLVGAAERGIGGARAPGTSTEIVRRLELELDAVGRSRSLERGLRAGRASG